MTPQSLHLRLVGGRNGPALSSGSIDPIAVLEADHALKMDLCDALEFLADGLPNEIDVELAKVAVQILRNGLPDHIALEEHQLFPMLKGRNCGDDRFRLVIDQLEHEHDNDEAFAYEIAEELERLVDRGEARNAEMLGYMLRGFFVGCRRHVCWENATVLPLARRTLTESDLSELRDAIVASLQREAGRRSMEALMAARAIKGQ